VVQKEPDNLLLLPEANIVLVKDTLHALQMLAASPPKKVCIPVIALPAATAKRW
jgi:UDP-N-acetylmuramyl pentapeptide synthase